MKTLTNLRDELINKAIDGLSGNANGETGNLDAATRAFQAVYAAKDIRSSAPAVEIRIDLKNEATREELAAFIEQTIIEVLERRLAAQGR